ncbi:transcriptional regulator [Campylobacter sp. RM12637]|uniref:transcriptional regulator n=1 Tax=Campylobacter sp. RM12637 TaxID=2735734 RepID=UPI0030151F0A|nr:transcriptional regulator [Campylobacter sp. RM12637]
MKVEEIKTFCKENNLTYKELAEKIGMSEGSLRIAIATNRISTRTIAAMNLLKKVYKLENELKDFRKLKEILSR